LIWFANLCKKGALISITLYNPYRRYENVDSYMRTSIKVSYKPLEQLELTPCHQLPTHFNVQLTCDVTQPATKSSPLRVAHVCCDVMTLGHPTAVNTENINSPCWSHTIEGDELYFPIYKLFLLYIYMNW